ncbi:MAG: bifunctional metallophosphatase/5'-nucleotidase, partial [Labilithrix sp.]|nr:bifunctional metallophosphatase/5'-nucleotidase [Labilithrix sp.]
MGAIAARITAALLAIGGVGLLAGSQPACSSNEDRVESPCPPGQTCDVSLTILHTSDIHSRLFPYEQVITQADATLGLGEIGTVANIGGVARMAYVLNRERARAGRVIHLDSGDCFQGAPVFNFFRGEPEVRAMSQLGVDAAVVGNHEFDFGAQNLATQFQRWSSFALLSANYKYENSSQDGANATLGRIGTVARPFTILNVGGLKIAVIGMANFSSLTSIFDQPNRSGITPLNTVEMLQFYIDLLRPYVDLIGGVSHMGLEVDQRAIRGTTGLDFIMGGHNHVVINPPQEIRDCSADPNNPGFVWTVDPNASIDPAVAPPDDPEPELKGPAGNYDPVNHPWAFKRPCKPRRVVIAHSGAFAKYVGRLDLVVTNEPTRASPTADPADYDPVNGFEIQTIRYQAFPIEVTVPEDPVMVQMLLPYQRALDSLVDLDILVGYSPLGSRRFSTSGGDSPLGNVVGNAIWLRLGIQTDFSLTNSTGIRADLNPGPVTIEQMFNIFPFDNSITKMQLSGTEVQELFDFTARRSARRGCSTQIQIAGARVRLNCSGCERLAIPCTEDGECVAVGRDVCDLQTNRCVVKCAAGTEATCALRLKGSICNLEKGECEVDSCAEQVYIGTTGKVCREDAECSDDPTKPLPGSCQRAEGKANGLCLSAIKPTNLYELATSNYLATGGSGFRVLQRNTTQFDTKIQQRDALIDYLRAGRPCGWDAANATPDGLKACTTDGDCGDDAQVCACAGHAVEDGPGCRTEGDCATGNGRCVRRTCRDEVAQFHLRRCTDAPDLTACKTPVNACAIAGEECKILACIDPSIGSVTDGRV